MWISAIYNHQHKLSGTTLGVRGIYILPALLLTLGSDSNAFNLIVFFGYMILTVKITSIKIQHIFRLIALPLLFVLYGCLAISLTLNSSHPFFNIKNVAPGFYATGVLLAIKVFTKSIALISMVYFSLLTHSISEISEVMAKCRIPKILIDLFTITYKFIENLLSSSRQMYTSQKCRLAYNGKVSSIYTFSKLTSAIFQRAILQSQHLEAAMESRGIQDHYNFIREKKNYCTKQILAPALLSIFTFITFIICRWYGW